MSSTKLGVCYYPEHWCESDWPAHAASMHSLGIELVRIGEFSWSRIEPEFERFEWAWLDTALDTLAAAGLKIILCTPTACPPSWLVERAPEILPLSKTETVRGFGSRRHYSVSSSHYLEQCERIVNAMVERYGQYQAIVGWQIDNELGCHDTTLSYNPFVLNRFRNWLRRRYESIDALNEAWGTVFWSQEYPAFDAIGFPGIAVTESNPALALAFRRFASDEVREFVRRQADEVRRQSRHGTWITHNFMGNFTDFDHYDVADELDVASWDSYPLGFLEQGGFEDDTKRRYRQTGHPDWAAFHHDLYRGVGGGRFAVMEQQPGPVNWAECNAAPLPGMLRLWTWEAIAHGAEFVSYFRWQQYPKAQEQMHAALNLPNGEPAAAQREIRQLTGELRNIELGATGKAQVALVFDYPSCWVSDIQPHVTGYSVLRQAFDYYSAARHWGLDVDIVPAAADLSGYRLILVPALLMVENALVDAIRGSDAQVVFGPRCGSKTGEYSIPANLPPGPLQSLIPLRVTAVDSIRAGASVAFSYRGKPFVATKWLEHIDTDLTALATTETGLGIVYANGNCHYIGANTSPDFLRDLIHELCERAGLDTVSLAEGLRLRRRGNTVFAFNYGPDAAELPCGGADLLIGSETLRRTDIAVWEDHRA